MGIVSEGSQVKEWKGIGCESDGACQGAKITVTNNGAKDIEIEELNCEAPGACAGAIFTFSDRVSLEECKCGDNGGCLGAVGISCFENMEKLECSDDLCAGKDITIINPEDGFEVICDDVASCGFLRLTVIINDEAEDGPIRQLGGIQCNGEGSCFKASFMIDNRQSRNINVDKIECEGKKACKSAVFNGNNVNFEEIKCDGKKACKDCMVGSESCTSSQSSAFISVERADNASYDSWGILSSVNPTVRWMLMSFFIIFLFLIVIAAYICICKRYQDKRKHSDDIKIQMDILTKDSEIAKTVQEYDTD